MSVFAFWQQQGIFNYAVLCFVLMGNHFHLVAQTYRPNLRRWIYAAVAQRIRRTKSSYNPKSARRLISKMLNVRVVLI